MQSIDVANWEEFEAELKKLQEARAERYKVPGPPPSGFLFRGQENSDWPLTTTLERKGRVGLLIAEYYRLLTRVQPQIETFTATNWHLPTYPEMEKLLRNYHHPSSGWEAYEHVFQQEAYDYMVHLRHHGFPSPLLDWTRSPYIAAFFAIQRPIKCAKSVSIYVYCEYLTGFKVWSSARPRIKVLGPYIRTHRRHFLQQCEYTSCVLFKNDEGWRFAPHESVFAQDDSQPRNLEQDVLWKFNIPSTERLKVLKLLDNYNLNAFSLFASEESLMETMALRELDFREKDS